MRGFAVGTLASLAILCSNYVAVAQSHDTPPQVLASTRPVHSIISAVMSGVGTPDLLISGSASPHAYALRPSDARKLQAAEFIFWIGPELEVFLENPLRSLSAAAQNFPLSGTPGLLALPIREGGIWDAHAHEGHAEGAGDHALDPHFWLDPRNGAAMASAIADILAEADPERGEQYRSNARGFAMRMAALDLELAERMQPAQSQSYIVFHDAYQYFEARYGLEPLGSVTIAADRPAGVRRIIDIRNRIANSNVKCVFSPPQYSPRLIATLTENAGTEPAELDELGTEITPGAGLYETLLVRMADDFLACLAD